MAFKLNGTTCAFILVNLLLTVFFLDASYTPNPMSRALPVLTLFEQHSLRIDRYKDWSNDKSFVEGHYYSDKPPLPTLLVAPFYGVLRWLRLDGVGADKFKAYPILLLGDFICGTLPFVLILLLTFLAVRSRSPDAVVLSCLPFYGSFLFVYAGAFFAHVLAGALLLACYVLLKNGRSHWFAGFLMGAAVLTEYPMALAGAIFGVLVLLLAGRRPLLRFLAGLLPWAMLGAIYNKAVTGFFLKTVTAFHADAQFAAIKLNYGFRLPSVAALWGLSLSPYRGLVFYAPVLIVMGYVAFRNRQIWQSWRSYLWPVVLINFMVISAHFTWWGGWGFGPRYLTGIATLLLYEGAQCLATVRLPRVAFYGFGVLGLLHVWLAKITAGYLLPEQYSFPLVQLLVPEFLGRRLSNGNVLTMWLGLSPGFAAACWLVLFFTGVFWLDLRHRRDYRGRLSSCG